MFPERLPSVWRLVILLLVLVASSISLCLLLGGIALEQDLDDIDQAVVVDDLGEYAALYRLAGVPAIGAIFDAGLHEDSHAMRVTAADGRVLFSRIPPALVDFQWPPQAPSLVPGGEPYLFRLEHPAHEEKLLVGAASLPDGATLWFGRTNEVAQGYVRHLRSQLWLAGLLACVVATIPIVWYSRHVMTPLRVFIGSARQLSTTGTSGARLQAPYAVPELKEFASAFNHALDRIAGLAVELQSANDHLAHELRTPLSRIRGNLEVLHDSTDNATARDAAERAVEEIDRATRLIQTILTVRAGDHGVLRLHLEPTAMGGLLQHLVQLYAAAAEERKLSLNLKMEHDVTLPVDRQRITQAVSNLLDNALDYTPAGGEVSVKLCPGTKAARIIVTDTGPGLGGDDVARLWQRYSRGSAASAEKPGMGLGLSLVRAIVTAHDGKLGAANRSDASGAEFWIEL